MIVKRIDPISCAKVAGIIYAILGFLVGAMFSMFGLLGLAFAPTTGQTQAMFGPIFGIVVGVGAIVFFPLFYGAIGAVFAMIGAWIYNVVASKIGGIKIEVA